MAPGVSSSSSRLPSQKEKSAHHEPSSSPVTFGSNNEWVYYPDMKRFDISRDAATKLVIEASDDTIFYHKGVMIDPNKTVLIVVDMQNYFIHPKCCDHRKGLAAVDPTLKVIERCRKEEIRVCWLNYGIDEEDMRNMPPAVLRGYCHSLAAARGHGWHVFRGKSLPDDQGRTLWKGSWNAQIYEPLPAASSSKDLFFDKTRPSGMWKPDEPLHKYLRESGKTTLIFAGVNSDQCVLGTLTDAYSWGFDCLLLSDCTGTISGYQPQELVNYNVGAHLGFLIDSEAFYSSFHDQ